MIALLSRTTSLAQDTRSSPLHEDYRSRTSRQDLGRTTAGIESCRDQDDISLGAGLRLDPQQSVWRPIRIPRSMEMRGVPFGMHRMPDEEVAYDLSDVLVVLELFLRQEPDEDEDEEDDRKDNDDDDDEGDGYSE